MKKLLTLLLCILMTLSMFGCSNGEKKPEKVKIAVGMMNLTEEYVRMQDYFDNYLGPELNVEFIYSSALANIEEYLTFIENAYTAGATGLLDFFGNDDFAEAIDAKCAEYNMRYATWSAPSYLALQNASGLLAGGIGSDATQLREATYNWGKKIYDGKGELHLVLFTIGAFMNSAQQVPSTTGAVQAVNENYNLGLSDDQITALVFSAAPTEWTNGSNVTMMFVPGIPGMLGDFDAVGNMIAEGKYDHLFIAGDAYPYFYELINRYEKEIGRNFSVDSLAAINAGVKVGFNELDEYGTPRLNSVLLKTGSSGVFALALLLNAMYGNEEVLGGHGVFPLSYDPLYSAAEYDKASKIDSTPDYYTITVEEFKQMVKFYNKDLTYEKLYEYVKGYSAASSVIERRNIQ